MRMNKPILCSCASQQRGSRSCFPLRCFRLEEPTEEMDCWGITFFLIHCMILNRVLRDHKEQLTEDLERNGLAGAATCRSEFASFLRHIEAHRGRLLTIHRQGSADSEVESALARVSVTAREGLGSDSGCQVGVHVSLVASVIVQSLNKANMLIVSRKGGCSIWTTITR